MRHVVRLPLGLFAAAVLVTACGGSADGAPAGSPGTDRQGYKATSLWVVADGAGKGGQPVPFENGTGIAVADVSVEFFIAPHPPAREGTIDLLITDRATGGPVSGGGLEIVFDMEMPHGSLRAEAIPAGDGHFLIPYLLVMPGTWEMDITISRANSVKSLAFIFEVD